MSQTRSWMVLLLGAIGCTRPADTVSPTPAIETTTEPLPAEDIPPRLTQAETAELLAAVGSDELFASMSKLTEAGQAEVAKQELREFFSALSKRVAAQADVQKRHELAMAHLFLLNNVGRVANFGGPEVMADAQVAEMVLTEVPPHSPLWSIAPYALVHVVIGMTGKPSEYDGYLAQVFEHPDSSTAGAALFSSAMHHASLGDEESMQALQKRLAEPRFADTPWLTELEQFLASPVLPGRRVPDFSIPALQEGTQPVTAASLKGSVVLLDLWATWCGPCVLDRSELHEAHDQYADPAKGGLKIVSVAFDATPDDVVRYQAEKWSMPWFNGFAEPSTPEAKALAQAFAMTSLPKWVLIDGDGTVLAVSPGLHAGNLHAQLETTFSR